MAFRKGFYNIAGQISYLSKIIRLLTLTILAFQTRFVYKKPKILPLIFFTFPFKISWYHSKQFVDFKSMCPAILSEIEACKN